MSKSHPPRPASPSPALLLAILIVSAGCGTTKSVVVSPHTGARNRGVVYALPKTLLKVTVPYTIQEKKRTVHGRNVEVKELPTVAVLEPVKVETVSVADDKNLLVISGKDVSDSWILESSLGFTVNENGLLVGVETDAKDKTFETAQALVTTGINVAKLIAVAGTEKQPGLDDVLKRIDEIYAEIAKVKADAKVTRLSKLQDLQKELVLLVEFVATYEKTNQTSISTSKVEYVAYLDPATCEKVADAGVRCEVQADGLGKNIPKTSLPKVTIHVDVPTDVVDGATKAVFDKNEPRQGIAYRIARPVTVRVSVSSGGANQDVGRGQLAIAQFGPVAFADVASKSFSSQKTAATFDASGIRAYKVECGSVADKGLTAIASSVESAQKAITAVRYDLELERLTKEKQLKDAREALQPEPAKSTNDLWIDDIKKQTELLKAQAELEKAKAELEKARKGDND